MTICVGIDGCRVGWIAVVRDPSGLSAHLLATLEDLIPLIATTAIVAIDAPIGLVDSGARECDRVARQRLGPQRRRSVFAAPIRPVLVAATHVDACEICARVEGKRMSLQDFAIVPKAREVDTLLRSRPWLQGVLREVHPELCFAVWNRGTAMSLGKKTAAGQAEREALIDAYWPDVRNTFLRRWPRFQVARDDINDAFAALWSAERIAAGIAQRIPSGPPRRDTFGLEMAMWA